MSILLFNGSLTNAFQPTQSFLLAGESVVLDVTAIVANAPPGNTPGQIEFYFEYTAQDPNAPAVAWFREVSEENIGNGNVRMNKVVRRFAEEGSDVSLAVGTHCFNMQFIRKGCFARLQVRVAAGGANACVLTVSAAFGSSPLSAA